jgi:hypothetical protein
VKFIEISSAYFRFLSELGSSHQVRVRLLEVWGKKRRCKTNSWGAGKELDVQEGLRDTQQRCIWCTVALYMH